MSTIDDPRRSWALLIGIPVAAVGLACLAACGGGTTSTGSGSQPSATAMQAFASCMAENGVTLPKRGNEPGGGSPPSAAPSAGGAGGGTRPSRAGGGTPATGAPRVGGRMQAPAGVDATTWAAAQKACAQYAPTRRAAPRP